MSFYQKLKNYCWHLPKAILANLIYRFPSRSLTIIAVTGTDGKTTTAHLIHYLLGKLNIPSEVISTINSPGLHTTSPDSLVVQKMLRQYSRSGVTHVVIEVTAHAIDQFRFWGCHFDVSVLTNTSHEHLDYFSNLNDYINTKIKLLKQSKTAIINHDDPSYPLFLTHHHPQTVTFGTKKTAQYQAKQINLTPKSLEFIVNDLKIKTDSPFYYQTYNILAAIAVINSLGFNFKQLLSSIKHFPDVVGRRQKIDNDLNINTLVDFAHTPAALEQTLTSLKTTTSGKLIVIFGATGGRDQQKRPLMGQVVSQIADIAIVTADDTRLEKIENINQQIISGFKPKNPQFKYFNIHDRQEAFNRAIKIAKEGDTIVACGKGHETSILHGHTEYPWSEAQAFRTAFRIKQNV